MTNRKLKCYYAHPISDYNTEIENQDIRKLESLGFEVLNPNNVEYEKDYKLHGMTTFLKLILQCDCLCFRAFDDVRATIPAGVAKEIAYADNLEKPVFEITLAIGDRILSVDDTRAKLKIYGRGNK